MKGLLLHHGAALLVCDGRKALFLVNLGHPGQVDLSVVREFEQDLPAHASDLGTDRPGLLRQTAAGLPGSAPEAPDRHDAAEELFLRQALDQFVQFLEARPQTQVVLVAPPRALATLRRHAPAALLARDLVQVDKDLTRHPVAEIARVLLG